MRCLNIWAQNKPLKNGGLSKVIFQNYAEKEKLKVCNKMHRVVRGVYLLIHQIRKNKNDSGGKNEKVIFYSCCCIIACHNKITDGGRVDSSVVDLRVFYLVHLLCITNSAPNDSAAIFGLLLYRSCQVAAKERSFIDLIIHIHHQHIPVCQLIHHPLIGCAAPALGCGNIAGSFIMCYLSELERKKAKIGGDAK